ncbi:synaptojanin-2-like [Haliotis cracherodii]|uniref:synaptojanin-2-like n=1 Tax=Haliotis cracherodii TaxID=6455 RepID=UPI0039ED0981
MAMGKGYRIFHKVPPDRETPYSVIMESKSKDESLMFESDAVVVLSSAEMDTIRKQYTKVLDAYGCLGVLGVNLGREKIMYLVMVSGCLSVGKITESEVFKVTSVQFVSLRNEPTDEDRIVELRKLLSSGTFYFSWSQTGAPWDLSLCAQRKQQDTETDNRFFWNRMLHVHLQRYSIDCGQWLLKIMCGGVEIRTIYAAHRQAKACIITRLSCERAGTRFNVRGTNDDGHVANFCETEQVTFLDDQVSSFIQTRGSVPLFWEQTGIQVGSHKIHMSRGYEASAPSYDRHLQMIKKQYGDQVLVNLLGCKEGEKMLSQAYQNHHKASVHSQDTPYYEFDYHSEVRGNLKNLEKLKSRIIKHVHNFEFFYSEKSGIKRQQTGTIRTNCVDCLDRTNSVQSMIGMEILPKQIESLGLANKPQMLSRFQEVYKQIWGLNGDHVSKIYAGTGALGGGRSKYSDAARSATRTIQNNFLDNSKQEAIDILLLGSSLYGELADKARSLLSPRCLHAAPSILYGMVQRYKEYTKPTQLRVGVGTWNVNGGKHFRSVAFKHQSVSDWLLDAHKKAKPGTLEDESVDYEKPVDIYAIGFEEIVDLNASNIMSASTANAREWQKDLLKTISRDNKYVQLTHIQLVGVVLYVFIRPHLAPFIRDVAIEKVKTGLGGAAGNKGGVAIRMLVHSTSVCFVCAHLAAGQSQVNERNADYVEITRKMMFPMGRTISSHDYVFWCGDFNYRIDMDIDQVKDLVRSENWAALQHYDQLNVQRAEGKSFAGFNEGKTNFPPTYKYDLFSDDYDTSEKSRTPAWTDRVLWRRKHLLPREQEEDDPSWSEGKLVLYDRADLKTSDHRPVLALLDIDVLAVDEACKERVMHEVVAHQGPPDGTVIVSLASGAEFDDDTIDQVVSTFTEVGDVTVVRFVGSDMWVIYKSGDSALDAQALDQQQVNGETIRVRLCTPDWRNVIEKELKMCALNTTALYNQFSNSLLGDDFSMPAMDYVMDDDEGDLLAGEDAMLPAPLAPLSRNSSPSSSGRNSPAVQEETLTDIPGGPPGGPPSRPPAAPSRPDKPPPRPAAGPGAGVVPPGGAEGLIVPEPGARLRSAPSPEMPRKQPPQRPGAPPAKPPPPQRPPGGPPKAAASSQGPPGSPGRNVGREAPKIRQPLRPPPSANVKARKGGPRVVESLWRSLSSVSMKAVGSAVSSWWHTITPLITFSQPLASAEETPITFTLPVSKEDRACSQTFITEDTLCSYTRPPCGGVTTYTHPLEWQGKSASYTKPSTDDAVETYSDPLEYPINNITDISPLPQVETHSSSAREGFTSSVQPLLSTKIQISTAHSLKHRDDDDDDDFQATFNSSSDDTQMSCMAKQYTSNKTDQASQIVPINGIRSPLETEVQQKVPSTECTNISPSPEVQPICNTGIKRCCCSTESTKESQQQHIVCLDGQFQHTTCIAKQGRQVLVLSQHLPEVTTIMQLSHSTQAMLRAEQQLLPQPATASPYTLVSLTPPLAHPHQPLTACSGAWQLEAILPSISHPDAPLSLTGFTECIQFKSSLTQLSKDIPYPPLLQGKVSLFMTHIQAMLEAQTIGHLDEGTITLIKSLVPFTPWIEQLVNSGRQETKAVLPFIQLQPYAEKKLKSFGYTKSEQGKSPCRAVWSVDSMKIMDCEKKSFNLTTLIQAASNKIDTTATQASEKTEGRFELGKGGFAKCYELTDLDSKEVFAGKIVSKSLLVKQHQKDKMAQEIAIHRELNHRHVVQFRSFFEDSDNVYIVLELCRRRSLMELHKRRKAITEPEARYFVKQVVTACQYLHHNKVIHRDLKLGNLFINDEMEIKIGDFGLATKVGYDGERKRTLCGTPNYIAPEVLCKKGHSFEVDIWSLGCILYTLLVGKPPFETSCLRDTYMKIKKNEYNIPSRVSLPARNLIGKMLKADPTDRPTIDQIMEEEFFSSGYLPNNLPTSCLTMAPRFDTLYKSEGLHRKPLLEINDMRAQSADPTKREMEKKESDKAQARCGSESQDNWLTDLCGQLSAVVAAKPGEKICIQDDDAIDPACIPIYWVSKWVDYSDKYGLGYQLCDNSVGVLFNDSTRLILLANGENTQYIERDGTEHYHTLRAFPENLTKKVTLLKYFRNYMNEHLLKAGANMTPRESDQIARLPFLRTWFRTRSAMVLQLSNGTVQINFFSDHTKIILCPLMAAVTYIDEKRDTTTFRLNLIEKFGCSKELSGRLRYARSMVERLLTTKSGSVRGRSAAS